ncbi:MAG TPA: preprotein translocase subunit YajC [Streptosporangiaceae bacterium]|jgi:preprotein translocase subunit YajC
MGNMILAVSKTATKTSGSSYTFLLIIIVIFGIFYFVMWRPQSRKRRAMMEQQRTIEPGQRVRTTAGMYATVVAVEDNDVVLEVAPGVHSRYVRRAVMEVLPDAAPEEEYDSSYGAAEDETTGAHDETPGDGEVTDVTHVADDESGHDGGTTAVHLGDESPNGSAPAAEETKAQDTV